MRDAQLFYLLARSLSPLAQPTSPSFAPSFLSHSPPTRIISYHLLFNVYEQQSQYTSTMATETQTVQHAPHLTVLTRVASIPLINDSLNTIHTTLTNNSYTRTPYSAAQALGSRAYRVSEPIQIRLAPVLERADDFANKAVDAVESRYPYPFKTTTEEVIGRIRKNSVAAVDAANTVIEGTVRSPARKVVRGVDSVGRGVVLLSFA